MQVIVPLSGTHVICEDTGAVSRNPYHTIIILDYVVDKSRMWKLSHSNKATTLPVISDQAEYSSHIYFTVATAEYGIDGANIKSIGMIHLLHYFAGMHIHHINCPGNIADPQSITILHQCMEIMMREFRDIYKIHMMIVYVETHESMVFSSYPNVTLVILNHPSCN